MKWLTRKEIVAAARKSDLAALRCSALHWEQIASASAKELKSRRPRKCR